MSSFKIVQNVDDKRFVVVSISGIKSSEIASFSSLTDAQCFLEYQISDKKNISVYLSKMIISSMDNECRDKNINRSDIVRDCLESRYGLKGLFQDSDLRKA